MHFVKLIEEGKVDLIIDMDDIALATIEHSTDNNQQPVLLIQITFKHANGLKWNIRGAQATQFLEHYEKRNQGL